MNRVEYAVSVSSFAFSFFWRSTCPCGKTEVGGCWFRLGLRGKREWQCQGPECATAMRRGGFGYCASIEMLRNVVKYGVLTKMR